MSNLESEIKAVIRDVPNFPKDGILFKDISTLLLQPELSNKILDALVAHYQHQEIDAIAGIESRGFLFGHALALRLNKPFVLIRKAGKLPASALRKAGRARDGPLSRRSRWRRVVARTGLGHGEVFTSRAPLRGSSQ